MAYSINPVLHHYANSNGLQKIYIQVIYGRKLVRVSTPYRIHVDQFDNNAVINHPNKNSINANLRKNVSEIENRLIDYLRTGEPTKEALEALAHNKLTKAAEMSFTDFIKSHADETKGKKADSTNNGYRSITVDIDDHSPRITFSDINVSWLNNYEKYQRGLGWDGNTVHKKMVRIKTMLNRAADIGLIDKNKFEKYKVPVYVQKIPEYISEEEMEVVKKIADATLNPTYKMAGYYFLLACYAGYRLSDLKKFDSAKYVKGDEIILRAKKNKQIVLIPIHTRLKSILEYVKDNPLTIVEQNLRDDVKELMKLAGIRRHIKIHTGRHSFAMMLMDRGVNLEDVAALLGVSLRTAGIYGRISNKRLGEVVRSKLG